MINWGTFLPTSTQAHDNSAYSDHNVYNPQQKFEQNLRLHINFQIYNLKNVEWFYYFHPKLVTFRSYECFFDNVIYFFIILKCIKYIYRVFIKLNAQTHPNNTNWSNFALKSTIYNVFGQIFWSTNLQLFKASSLQSTGFTPLNTYLQSTSFSI